MSQASAEEAGRRARGQYALCEATADALHDDEQEHERKVRALVLVPEDTQGGLDHERHDNRRLLCFNSHEGSMYLISFCHRHRLLRSVFVREASIEHK